MHLYISSALQRSTCTFLRGIFFRLFVRAFRARFRNFSYMHTCALKMRPETHCFSEFRPDTSYKLLVHIRYLPACLPCVIITFDKIDSFIHHTRFHKTLPRVSMKHSCVRKDSSAELIPASSPRFNFTLWNPHASIAFIQHYSASFILQNPHS